MKDELELVRLTGQLRREWAKSAAEVTEAVQTLDEYAQQHLLSMNDGGQLQAHNESMLRALEQHVETIASWCPEPPQQDYSLPVDEFVGVP